MSNSCIWPIEMTLSDPNQGGAGIDGNKGVLRVFSSSRTWAWPSDSLVSHPGNWLTESYPFVEMQCILQPQLTDIYI